MGHHLDKFGSTWEQMLYTKFQGHQPFGSKDDFWMFLSYMGMAAILVMCPKPFEVTSIRPSHESATWNLASIGLVVIEEKSLKILNMSDLDQGQWPWPLVLI